MPGIEKIHRRKIIINRKSQLYLSLIIVIYLAIYTIFILGVILIPSAMGLSRPGDVTQRQNAGREFLFLDRRVVPVIIVAMILMAIHFLFTSNRIFGPLYRLKGILGAWAEGTWPKPFRGRSGDFHGEFFDAFNGAARKLGEDVIRTRERLLAAIDRARTIPRGDLTREASEALDEVEGRCREALQKLDAYTF